MKSMEDQLKDMEKDFMRYGSAVDTEYKKAIEKSCIIVKAQAIRLAPYDTGLLRKSIMHRISVIKGKIFGVVGTNVEYAPFIEFGTGKFAADGGGRKTPWFVEMPDGTGFWTSGNKPQPFLGPAFDQNAAKIEAIIKDAVKKTEVAK